MKNDLQVHKIVGANPFNIYSTLVVILINLLKIFLCINDALLDVIVIARLIIECFD